MSERRRVPRYLYNGTAHLIQTSDGSNATVTLQSISVSGCRVAGTISQSVGQKCVIVIEWQGRQFRSAAEMVWKKLKGAAGLNFISPDAESLAVLRRLCATLNLEPLEPLPPEHEKRI